jgi:hypothetical protein
VGEWGVLGVVMEIFLYLTHRIMCNKVRDSMRARQYRYSVEDVARVAGVKEWVVRRAVRVGVLEMGDLGRVCCWVVSKLLEKEVYDGAGKGEVHG